MRDIILLAALLAVVPLTFRAPIIGVLAWIWITLMNPQREVYSFLHGVQLNLVIAVLTGLAWIASKERKVFPLNAFTVALVAFTAWTCVTTSLALEPKQAYPLLDRTIKSVVLVLAVTTLANTKARLQAVVWMLVVSLGYYAVKGGGFVILGGGHHRVMGPAASMIEDNNALGLALLVLLPLVNYLRATSRLRVTRWTALGSLVLTVVAIIGTYSRGALLGLGAVIVTLAMRSRAGIVILLASGVLASSLVSALPPAWKERMSTIQSAGEDASFEGRIAAWKTSYAIAKARPLTGGGFKAVEQDWVTQRYTAPGSLTAGKAAHSIYFQVLGDHGFVGLGLYLLLLGAAGLNTVRTLNATRGRPDLAWADQLARMLQVSMVAFLVGGAALSMAYYDGVLLVLALTAAVLQIVRQPVVEGSATAAGPRWKKVQAGAPVDAAALARKVASPPVV